ncbi:O14I1 protein, partial [Paradoxornis webbianus]|nr:O14I1 protein [Sinosuthora webbiana]
QISNSSSSTQFLLLAFTDLPQLQLLHLEFFLGISLAALLGNGLIIPAGVCDQYLHTPRDFFLFYLSLFHQDSICTTVLKAMANSLSDTTASSCGEWGVQDIFFCLFLGTESSLLPNISYNCSVLICISLWSLQDPPGQQSCAPMAA